MTERAQEVMNKIWQHRKDGADTEEKLVSAILSIATESVQFYNTQDGRIVLDKNDLLQLAEELKQ
jgi:NTP pyrophosphatase (non-canonical NTP hydrolase)